MIGLLRVRNEARWIKRSIESILPVCERVLVMDDSSQDDTREICAALPKVEVFCSPFTGLNESRDKQWLLERAGPTDAILWCDGDEVLTRESIPAIKKALATSVQCWSFTVKYVWDREDQIRTDGVYGRFKRPSMFRPGRHSFASTNACGNLHCGNVPLALQRLAQPLDASLLHFGYMHKADRLRKYEYYNQQDPGNPQEDGYRHMVIGDLFPAESVFKLAGPLELVTWI